ncbi:MAG: response regulator [Pseudomonadota bacterium]
MAGENWDITRIAYLRFEPVNSPSGDVIDLIIRDANAEAKKMFGWGSKDLRGVRSLELAPDLETQPSFIFLMDCAQKKTGGGFVTRPSQIQFVNGRRHFINAVPDGDELVVTVQDVTHIARDDTDIQDELRLFQTACDHAVQGIALSDKDGNLFYANQAFADLLGYTRDELMSLTSADLVHPEDLLMDERYAEDLVAGHIDRNVRDKRYIRKGGELVHTSVALSVVQKFANSDALFIRHIRDITEEREAEAQLRRALIQAKEAAELKSQFLANMSHEIRTPLNGIIGMAQVLEHSELDGEQAQHLSILKESGNTLMALLNDILDLSKIEAGKLEITPIEADVRHKLSRMFRVHEMTAREKGLTFRSVIHPSVPARLIFDPVRTRQCLDNLISNALKFTEHGEVIVAITAMPAENGRQTLTVHVSDTGPGIPENKQESIFHAFKQVDGGVARLHGGTGLGLTITRQLAELMGGDLSLKSEVSRGSIFTLRFEAGAVARKPAESPKVKQLPARRKASSELTGQRILVVDDNSINRRVACTLLGAHGIETGEAENGVHALQLLSQQHFDVVLLDIHMPMMDGRKTFEEIRRLDAPISEVPCIALTADAMSGDREKYIAFGMNGYVSKPVDERELIAEISRVLDRPLPSVAAS